MLEFHILKSITKAVARFLIESQSGQHGELEGVQAALGLAIKWCNDSLKNGAVRSVVLLVPMRGNVEGTTLGAALGLQPTRSLLAKKTKEGAQVDVKVILPAEPQNVPANMVVEEGFKMLAAMVNVSTGLSHPLDKPKAVALFRLLFKSGETFEASEVRAWALRNGWAPHHATQLEEVAQAVLDRRRIQGSREATFNAETLRKQRERAAQKAEGT